MSYGSLSMMCFYILEHLDKDLGSSPDIPNGNSIMRGFIKKIRVYYCIHYIEILFRIYPLDFPYNI